MLKLKKHKCTIKREDCIFPFFHKLLPFVFFLTAILFFQSPQAATYSISGNIAGEATSYIVGEEDTLYSIARKFDLGLIDLMSANPGIDSWVPGVGNSLVIPTSYILPDTKRSGIVINLSELRLYYFTDSKNVMTFPVGIGREGWKTPIGETTIILKRKNPVWTPPPSILAAKPDLPRIIPAGPDNPLGQYALSLGWESYAIHGTNKPSGIGLRSSHGCIRMYPEDIKILFAAVNRGTKVTVIDKPYKLAWVENKLYLEASPTEAQSNNIIDSEEPEASAPPEIYRDIDKMAGDKVKINWKLVDEVLLKRTGTIINITLDNQKTRVGLPETLETGSPTE